MKIKWSMVACIAILLISIVNHLCYIHNENIVDEKMEIISQETGEPIETDYNLISVETRVIINKVISFLCSIAGIVFIVNKRKEPHWEYFVASAIMITGTIIMLIL